MKAHLLFFFYVVITSQASAQSIMHRKFMQPPLGQNLIYMVCDMRQPVQTADKGYLFSYNPWTPNIHSPYPIDDYIIKTDSNFVPQWRKHYPCQAIPLPTGGIMVYYNAGTYYVNGFQKTHIQKVTASGVVVWAKYINEDIRINGGVQYGNKVRFVGGKLATAGLFPMQYTTSEPYSIEFDTTGNVLSQALFPVFTSSSSSQGFGSEFLGIEMDAQNNFYVNGTYSSFVLAKFNSSFTLQWARAHSSSEPLTLTDLDFLPSGRIMATGKTKGSWGSGAVMATILKLDQQGNIIDQKYLEKRFAVSGLCRKPNGQYAVTMNSQNISTDSLYIMNVDTMLNVTSYSFMHRGIGAGTPVLKGTELFTPVFNVYPYLISSNLSGQNCYSAPLTPTSITSQVSLSPFQLNSPVQPSYAVLTSTYSAQVNQTYADSCTCGPSVSPGSGCAGTSVTLSANGSGTISWYTSATATTAAATGPTYQYSSSSAVTTTLYVEDGACANNVRVAVTLTVFAAPAITVASSAATLCTGNSVQITLTGGSSYTWSSSTGSAVLGTSPATLAISPAQTSTYTVKAENPQGCSSSKQHVQLVSGCAGLPDGQEELQLRVYPNPAANTLYLHSSGSGDYSLYDLTGRTLSQGRYSGVTAIPVTALAEGAYLLSVEEGQRIRVLRIVVERER